MISLNHLLIEPEVLGTKFSCDLAACKGACCTLPGGGGAPVLDSEVEEITAAVPAARVLLNKAHRKHLDKRGPLAGAEGHWETTCIEDLACVFVVWEGETATCAFEKAWHAGTSAFRKPLSCHLFPIRVENFGGPYLRYEQYDECEPGRQRGVVTGTPLVKTVREALVRAYGAEITDAMIELADPDVEGETA